MGRRAPAVLVLVLAACGERRTEPAGPADGGRARAARLEAGAIPEEVAEGEAVVLSAILRDDRDASAPAVGVVWSVSPAAGARLDGDTLTPLHEGVLTVTAAAHAQEVTRTIRVRALLAGIWERRTEPFAGLRIAIQPAGGGLAGSIERAPPVTEERIAGRGGARAKANAELECQRSLWREGEPYLEDVARRGSPPGRSFAARILVRDWGLTPHCEHRDTRATARIEVVDRDRLELVVTRGASSTTQEWVRAPRTPR